MAARSLRRPRYRERCSRLVWPTRESAFLSAIFTASSIGSTASKARSRSEWVAPAWGWRSVSAWLKPTAERSGWRVGSGEVAPSTLRFRLPGWRHDEREQEDVGA